MMSEDLAVDRKNVPIESGKSIEKMDIIQSTPHFWINTNRKYLLYALICYGYFSNVKQKHPFVFWNYFD
jgi:hypothetical protein